MNESEEAEIVAMYTTNDVPVWQICHEMGVRAPTVYNVLRKYNVPLRGHKRAGSSLIAAKDGATVRGTHGGRKMLLETLYTPEVMQTLVGLYVQGGLAATQISVLKDIPYHHVLQILEFMGVPRMPGATTRTRALPVAAEVMQAFRDGMGYGEMCETFDITLGELLRVIRKDPQVMRAEAKGALASRFEALVTEAVRRVKEDLHESGAVGVSGVQLSFPFDEE